MAQEGLVAVAEPESAALLGKTSEAEPACRHSPSPYAEPRVNGVRVDPVRVSELGPRIASFLACGRTHVVHFVCADPTVVARRSPPYRVILNRGDLNLADGMPVAWVLRRLGHATDQITGSDALWHLCEWGRDRGIRHFLYGATPRTLVELQAHLRSDHPGIEIAGAIAPPFGPLSQTELRRDAACMRERCADLVWVGLGTPKQDLVAERLRKLEAAPVILCVGAAFDFAAATKKSAPRWMRKTGLEWLFRLCCEPRRLWRRYLLGNPQFVFGVVRDIVRRKARGIDVTK